ncbi:DUF1499 domain-containing protein [Alteromonas ponticola]|uniref:DUF1499 domain-containing protein n=1 Tax=Alteromonas ponticola TaxID=2720613 RepID=A0ABX1R087_9ALTE|nr:DUF1499 domain-containing protein [Alteromonas ponticola]NMH59879.1 DUF1499 domain-containing protein [Alteromonas ponticola]
MKAIVALVSIVSFLMVVLPGLLYQFAGLSLGLAFTSFRFGLFVGVAALVLIILQLLFARKTMQWGKTAVWTAMALVAIVMPLQMMGQAKSVPPIHDISTDVSNPPAFVAVAPKRADAPNPLEYAGGEVTRQQLEAYPNIKTQVFSQPLDKVYTAAEKAVAELGWERTQQNALENTIEATDTTFWFGFKDDVVIRLTAKDNKTLVDVRSKSRVGMSDLGKNAQRIEAFFDVLHQQLAD